MNRLFLLLITLRPLAAEAERVDTLREAQVAAHRLRQPTDVPSYSLDSMALMRQGTTSLSDALRRLPGINLRDYGGAGGLKTVSVRGMGAAHTQIVLDGLPTSNAQQGAVDLSRYDLGDLSALSLTIGEQSDLLCPVRTMSAATLSLQSHRFRPYSSEEITLTHSSWNAWQARLSATQKAGPRTQFCESLRGEMADNDYPYVFGGEHLRRHNSQFSSGRGQLACRSTLLRGQLDGAIHYWGANRHLPGPVIYYNPTAGTERLHEQEALASLQWRSRLPHPVQWQAAGRYAWQQSHYRNNSPTPTGPQRQNYDQQEAYTTAGLSYQPTPRLGLAYSADYTLQTLHSNLPTDNNAVRHYLQQALSMQYRWAGLQATLRLIDHYVHNHTGASHSTTQGQTARDIHRLTPSLALSYRPCPAVQLRAHYKEAFRSPTFTENYYYHLGSTQLRPELTRQFGTGIVFSRHYQHLDLTASADAYVGRVRDRIVSIPYNLFVWRTVNKDHVRTAGLDAIVRSTLTLRRHILSLAGNYSYQRAQAEGHQLPYSPLHSGAVSLGWENPWVNATLSLTAAAQRTTTLTPSVPSTILPRYHEMNLSLWHRFAFTRRPCSLVLRADALNLTNQHYFVIARYPMPGISYRLTLTIKIH
ncbi:MAG: TonB-dependent receptor [Bacteroidaceae bacterium]|nr:TonB-dependent receptor [Bacteroidaceae bacterium]